MSPYNCGCVFFLSAFLIEEDTELQRTAAISDHLIKTLTGFLVKNDLDDGSYALMREVSTMKYRGGEGRVGMSSAVLDLGMWWWINWRTTCTTLAMLKNNAPPLPITCSDLSPFDWIYLNTALSLLLSLPDISISTCVMRFLYVPYITANHFWSFTWIIIFFFALDRA